MLGYDTTGRVVSDNEPIEGVSFLLFTQSPGLQAKVCTLYI